MASRAFIARLITASSSWVAIGIERPIDRARDRLPSDVAPDGLGQQFGHLAELIIDVDTRSGQRLPPRKGEKLARQLFAPLDRGKSHLHPGLQPIVSLTAADHFEAALQHRQQIVEIVRDAPGQLAQRLHLLRLVELGLGSCAAAHLALEALRGGSPAPAGDLLLLKLPDREERHAEQSERGRDRKQQIVDQIGSPGGEDAAFSESRR